MHFLVLTSFRSFGFRKGENKRKVERVQMPCFDDAPRIRLKNYKILRENSYHAPGAVPLLVIFLAPYKAPPRTPAASTSKLEAK